LGNLVDVGLDWLADIPETERDWQAVKEQYQAAMPF
jgi:hypothetical protein